MFDIGTLDARALRSHAAEVSALRIRLVEVGSGWRRMEWNDESFGSLSGWIADALARRTARQIELIDYVAENFELIAEELWRAAEVHDEAETTGPPAGLLPRRAPRTAEEWPVVEPVVIRGPRSGISFTGLHARIAGGEWVDEELAGVSVGGPADLDPFAALPADGPGWAKEHLEPLRSMLEGLAGRPELVAAQAAGWHLMAAELHAAGTDLQRMIRTARRWRGPDVGEYVELLAANLEGITGLVGTATAMALSAQGADRLVRSVRCRVGGLVADLVAELVRTAGTADAPERTSTAAVAECHRLALHQVAALVTSFTALAELLEG